MKSLSSVGIGLSVVFTCLFFALIAELYYLFWWKKRLTTRSEIENHDYTSPAKELFYMFCWRKHSAFSHSALNPQEFHSSLTSRIPIQNNNENNHNHHNTILHDPNNDFLFKPFGEDDPEAELMRLQSCSGPPRFLFTIIEETKEDLESEDGKSHNKSRKGSRSRSLSDLLVTVETPYLTPLASPPFVTPPLTPRGSYGNQPGFNILFESTTDAEFNRMRSSPPPKFKFLQEAEEKLLKKRLMEKAENETTTLSSFHKEDEEEESFITITVDDKNKAKDQILNHHHHQSSTSSQVLPLASSPSTFRSSPFNNHIKLNPQKMK